MFRVLSIVASGLLAMTSAQAALAQDVRLRVEYLVLDVTSEFPMGLPPEQRGSLLEVADNGRFEVLTKFHEHCPVLAHAEVAGNVQFEKPFELVNKQEYRLLKVGGEITPADQGRLRLKVKLRWEEPLVHIRRPDGTPGINSRWTDSSIELRRGQSWATGHIQSNRPKGRAPQLIYTAMIYHFEPVD